MEATIALSAKAGFVISGCKRSYRPAIDDPELEVQLLRAQEISRYVEHGYLDAGVTGATGCRGSEVQELAELSFSEPCPADALGVGCSGEFPRSAACAIWRESALPLKQLD